MNGAMPLKPAHRLEGGRAYGHAEMTFAPFTIPRMAAMFLAFVHDFKSLRRERLVKTVTNLILDAHFSEISPFTLRAFN